MLNNESGYRVCGIFSNGDWDQDEFRMSHSIFLIENPRQTSTRLTCKIKICDIDDYDSICRKAGRSCDKYKPPVCEAENYSIDTRIVGGSEDLETDLPFESLTEWILYISMGCGASWIDANTILTAAHCFDFETDEDTGYRLNKVIPNKIYELSKYNKNDQNDTEFLVSFLGSQVVVHPGYNDVTKLHDVAIINLWQVEKNHKITVVGILVSIFYQLAYVISLGTMPSSIYQKKTARLGSSNFIGFLDGVLYKKTPEITRIS